MNLHRRLFAFALDCFVDAFRLRRASRLACHLAERISPVYDVKRDGQSYSFYCPNRLTQWRVETFFTKEPETIEWIDTFQRGEILFDVGANIGLYSLYAAKKGVFVVAFEPESQNYALLNRNVYLNRASDDIICLNVALSDRNCVDYLYLPEFRAGGALNNHGTALDWRKRPFKPKFKQGAISYTLDSFLMSYPNHFPNHIKIDVDGLEAGVVRGAQETLRDSRLKSLSIELNDSLPEDRETIESIRSSGMTLLHKKHSDMFEGGEFGSVYNYCFVR